jgi:two-component system sensor histidine kinase BaeS
MRLRLWHRLFIAFAALSVLALLAFASWQQHVFRRGFLAYLDQMAVEQLRPATSRLAAAYQEHGGWAFLRGDPHAFDQLLDPRSPSFRVPAPPPDDRGPGSPPPERPAPELSPRPAPDGPPPMSRGPQHVTLFDAGGQYIAGDPHLDRGAHELSIELDGRRIGVLRIQHLPRISGALDVEFARAQARATLYAGACVLVVAFLLAYALARWLLAPVHALTSATHALAAGDYARRVDLARNDELGVLAADFNRLAAGLEQHREARRRWGADIAHELRTPLSVLRGEVQALQDGLRTPNAQAFASLDAECGRLASLVDDLYQLSLADAGALEYGYENVDPAAIVRESIGLQHKVASDAGLAMDAVIGPMPWMRLDPRRFAQLLDNLLANSRRYTDAPGRIRVELGHDGDALHLIVEDSAPGVPAQHLPHLFERLYRVEGSRTRTAGGAGLGLAICRAIVAAHGGSIEAMASPLGGLRIHVRLPGRPGTPA